MRATVDTREQEVSLEPYLVPGHRGLYRPDRTAVHAPDGTAFEVLDDPRGALRAMPPGAPWSASPLLYFLG